MSTSAHAHGIYPVKDAPSRPVVTPAGLVAAIDRRKIRARRLQKLHEASDAEAAAYYRGRADAHRDDRDLAEDYLARKEPE